MELTAMAARATQELVCFFEPSGGPPGISTISPAQHGGMNSQEMGLTVKVKGWLGSLRERRGATILRALALSAGAFLVVTGVIGLSAIAFGELVYFVGSIYTIIFGLTALVVEVKHKLPLVGIAYEWIDTYLKFLTVQRGKGVRRVPHRHLNQELAVEPLRFRASPRVSFFASASSSSSLGRTARMGGASTTCPPSCSPSSARSTLSRY